MSTKHQPATPLPPCEATMKTVRHGNGYRMVMQCPCGSPMNEERCPRTLAIKAEQERRANAYPKLVEALRALHGDCRATATPGHLQRVYTLLRELGEVS